MEALSTIRQKIRSEKYKSTDHARTEMQDDDLQVGDIERAILNGRIEKTLTEDLRGPRYVVVGRGQSDNAVTVICRVLPTGILRIITVWSGGLDEE